MNLLDLLNKLIEPIQDSSILKPEISNPNIETPKVSESSLSTRAISMSSLYTLIMNKIGMETNQGALLDLYLDKGSLYAIISNEGILYKSAITWGDDDDTFGLGQFEKVIMTFPAAENPEIPAAPELHEEPIINPPVPLVIPRKLMVRKIDNTYRWFAMPACTAVLNRVVAIDSTKLFDSFIKNAPLMGMPELRFFHEKPINIGKADFIDREEYSYIASGLFYDDVISQRFAEALANSDEDWGLSIGYFPIKEPEALRMNKDISIPVYEEGWNEEISILPEKEAASLFTSYLSKEVNIMEQRVKDALKKLIPESDPLFQEIVQKVDGVNRTIEDKDMIRRSKEETTETSETPEVPETPVTTETSVTPEATPEEPACEIPEEKTEELSEERKRRPAEDPQVAAANGTPSEDKPAEGDAIAALVKLLTESEAFKAAVKAAIDAQMKPAETREMDAVNQNFEAVNKAIEALNANHQELIDRTAALESKLEQEEKETVERVFEWKADLPAKVVHVKSFRPSVDRIPKQKERNIGQLSERAQSVLEKMPAPVTKAS